MEQQMQPHIEIPFDELQLFKDEFKYQQYLKETLLLSTIMQVHSGKYIHTAKIIVTKFNVWLIKDQLKHYPLPLNCITAVVKSLHHPQMTIITDQTQDNLRLSAASNQRCHMLISALAYIWTFFNHTSLPYYKINHHSLQYFERTSVQKQKGQNISLAHYHNYNIKYSPSQKNSHIVYDKTIILANKKITFPLKFSQNEKFSHYLSKMQDELMECYRISFCQKYWQRLKNHVKMQLMIEKYGKDLCIKIRKGK